MSNYLKLELSKFGLIVSWLGSGALAFVLLINMAFVRYAWFPRSIQFVGYIVFVLLFCLQFPMLRIRNKYRDICEYDENGISKAYGNFSTLSNQERKAIEKEKLLKRELLIDSATLRNITKKGSDNPESELYNLVGLSKVKDEVHKLASKIAFQQELGKKKRKKKDKTAPNNADTSYHMIFTGKAGTGKTTVARIMSGFLYKYKVTRKNTYIEVDGNFFNGNSYGESTERVKYILGQARGGVLFIDEAYALLNSVESQEVIATIIAFMENHRDDIVIIFAGYDQEMKALVSSNTGFSSRIKYFIHFEDYSDDELWEIFVKMANERGFSVDAGVKDNFLCYILEEKRKPSYGNARTVRTILDKTLDNHSVNYMDKLIPEEDKICIVAEDLPTDGMIRIKTIKL